MDSNTGIDKIIRNSSLYREFQAERDEIMKHKWIESEKVNEDNETYYRAKEAQVLEIKRLKLFN